MFLQTAVKVLQSEWESHEKRLANWSRFPFCSQPGELINKKTANINVKNCSLFYTHVNGDRPSHIENSKYKKSYFTILLHIDVRWCAV